jgi:hypothetical protein
MRTRNQDGWYLDGTYGDQEKACLRAHKELDDIGYVRGAHIRVLFQGEVVYEIRRKGGGGAYMVAAGYCLMGDLAEETAAEYYFGSDE